MKLKSGPKPQTKLYEVIIALRKKRKSIAEIGKLLKMSKQGVAYYLKKYGDIDNEQGVNNFT